MHTLICGSLAYDTIMVFQDQFKKHILPDKIHMLNVAFLVPEMRRNFGGTAGNIAYNLKLLHGSPMIMATVGDDFAAYAQHLRQLDLPETYITRIPDTFTGQAFITTDLDDNQITAFHPGAMNHSEQNHVRHADDISLGIVSPDGREGMLQHAGEFQQAGIPWIFDPGQAMPLFNDVELMAMIEQASYVTVNDYEAQMLIDKTGCSLDRLRASCDAFIITKGAQGAVIYTPEQEYQIPCVEPTEVVDPTGCGDAFRAGLLYGLQQNWDWQTTGQLASVMGALKIAHQGGQNHKPTLEQIQQRYQDSFNSTITLS